MDDRLDLHAASSAERLAIYRNVHDVWGRGLPMEEHVQRRLASVQHNRAAWHCGTIGGRVVVSLGCYPLWFHVGGQVVPGFAIGAVHTVADHRRRGYAARLIQYVEAAERVRGAEIALLYSDISPRYYHRLGYRRCPSWTGIGIPTSIPQSRATDALVELEPDPVRLASIYDVCHGSSALAIARPPDYYWQYLIAKSPGDRFLGWVSAGEVVGYARVQVVGYARVQVVGYARVQDVATEWRLRDWAVAPPREPHLDALVGGLIHTAANAGASQIVGWIPRNAAFTRRFLIEPRRMEITMLKRLDDESPEITPDMRSSAEYFQEIDHV
jgi:GNAT superfamily N-acetyltransferase